MKKKTKIILISIFSFIILIISAIIIFINMNTKYYYIDFNGEKGVADKCEVTKGGLICDREYGGKIHVVQYWEAD